MAIFGFLRADEEEEKRRTRQGGIKNRIFNFLDDTIDNPGRRLIQGRDLAVSAARSTARVPETVARTVLEAGPAGASRQLIRTRLAELERAAETEKDPGRKTELKKRIDKAKKQAGDFDSGEVKDPVRRVLYGSEPVETYQTRREGYQKALEEGTSTGADTVGGKGGARKLAAPLSFLGIGLTAGADLVPSPGKAAKGALKKAAGKEGAEKVVKGAAEELIEGVSAIRVGSGDSELIATVKRGARGADDVLDAASSVRPAAAKTLDIASVTPEDGFRQRGLLRTTQQEGLDDAMRQGSRAVEPQTYQQMSMEETLTRARERVSTKFDEAKSVVDDAFSNNRWDDETSSLTRALVEKAASEGNDTLVKELMEKAAPFGTRSGQANVLWRGMANSYDPEGMVRFAQKVVDDANDKSGLLTKGFRQLTGQGKYTLDDATKDSIRQQMRQALKLADGPDKDQAMKQIFETINDRIPPGASEMFDAYRYQNLLSNPRTQARNVASNLFNTMVTRPATLATRASTDWFGATLFGKDRQYFLKEVPEYYRGLANSMGDAIEASRNAWKGLTEVGQPDLRNLRSMRDKKLPGALTAIPRGMEAQDKFFSTLISAGEYAAQKSKGVADDVAQKEADRVATYSLFRSMTDPRNATGQGALLSKIDQLTEGITNLGNKVPAFRWFVPFVRTPVNVSKQLIEFSPAGFATLPGSTRKIEQFSKAAGGTMLTMLGAKLALDGQTTWDAPKDQTERQLFYESGKRPYSIRIGDKWVPMIYFGPYALSFALPAAARDANQDAPLDATTLERLGGAVQNSLKFFSQQTYVQGIANIVDLVSGEGDANLMNSLGFTAGQALPAQGLLRYVAGVFDPTFRKAEGFTESIQKDIPFASRGLEPYTNLSGEESVRAEGELPKRLLATDYSLPYTLGNANAAGDNQALVEANSEFFKTLRKTSRPRTKANDEINAALEARDYEKAQRIAENYNAKLKEAFKPWLKKHGDQADNEFLATEYNSQKLHLTRSSIAQRRYNQRRRALRERSLVSEPI